MAMSMETERYEWYELGQRLIEARISSPYKAEQLAAWAGVAAATYYRYEEGKLRIPLKRLERIAPRVNKTVEWFLGNEPVHAAELRQAYAEAAGLPGHVQIYLAGVLRMLVKHEQVFLETYRAAESRSEYTVDRKQA